MVLCKKSDSVMRYSGGGSPKDVFLAPKDFAGYVLLVNTGKKEKCNCISLRLIIDGSVRILLLTSKKIKKGQELLYSYGDHYKFKVKNKNL